MEVDLVFSRVHDKFDLSILDVGSHHGEFLDVFERHPDPHRYDVVCVEPLPENVAELKLRLRGLSRVSARVADMAISDVSGTRTFYLGEATTLFTCTPEWRKVFADQFAHHRELEIECVTVRELLETVGLDPRTRFDLVKVDTEGHDVHVLQAFAQSDATADAVIFEIGPDAATADEAVGVLENAGYREFYVFGRVGIPTTYVGEYRGAEHLRDLIAAGRIDAGNIVAFL